MSSLVAFRAQPAHCHKASLLRVACPLLILFTVRTKLVSLPGCRGTVAIAFGCRRCPSRRPTVKSTLPPWPTVEAPQRFALPSLLLSRSSCQRSSARSGAARVTDLAASISPVMSRRTAFRGRHRGAPATRNALQPVLLSGKTIIVNKKKRKKS